MHRLVGKAPSSRGFLWFSYGFLWFQPPIIRVSLVDFPIISVFFNEQNRPTMGDLATEISWEIATVVKLKMVDHQHETDGGAT